MKIRPETAREIILALCIESPKREDPFSRFDMLSDRLGMEYAPDMYLPMFFRGPFLRFLQVNPATALETILTLVNFTTERWLESQQAWATANGQTFDAQRLQIPVLLNDRVAQWTGDERVYGWFRNHLISAKVIVSALMACEKWLYDLLDANEDIRPWITRILEGSRSVAFAGLLVEVGKRNHELFAGPLMPLLGIWELYEWDHQLLVNKDVWRIDMMSWALWSERIWNLVRDWHSMPHRQESIQQIGAFLLIMNIEVQHFYARAREQWQSILNADPGNRNLELLIARFDPVNYTSWEADDGTSYVGLKWPDKLRARTDAQLHKNQTSLELLRFPVTCRQILDGEETLEQEAVPAFWERLQHLAELDASQDADFSAGRLAAAVCGGIAVLFIEHKTWLESDEDRFRWCMERLSSILDSPPPRDRLEVAESVSTFSWHSFLAEVAVALLADAPHEESVRRLVAESVACYYYQTTALAMRAGYRFRGELGDDFSRIRNLAVLWAALRILRDRRKMLNCDLANWSVWYDRLIDAFVEETLPVERISWDRVESFASRSLERMERRHRSQLWGSTGDESPDGSEQHAEGDRGEVFATPVHVRFRHRRVARLPGLDLRVLQSAFSWLPTLSQAQDAQERGDFIDLWRALLAVVLRMIRSRGADEHGEVSGTPYEYDTWVFGGIAQAVAQMTSNERREQLWRPILNLGPRAHRWVKPFLEAWIIDGPRLSPSPAAFVERWRLMIQFCLNSPKWHIQEGWGLDLDEVYVALMGLGLGSEQIARDEFADPIGSLLDLYERWAKDWLGHWYVLRHFAVFLTKPAARGIVCPAIQWIRSTVKDFDDYDWRGFTIGELESLIAGSLRTCWLQHRQDVQYNDDLRTAFIDLLNILTSRLCPSALELRDEVLRSFAK